MVSFISGSLGVYEEFKDTKGVIRIHKSKRDRQYNDQKQKDKQRPINHTHKTKDRVTQTPLKTEGEPRCSGRVDMSIESKVYIKFILLIDRRISICLDVRLKLYIP